MKTKSLLLIFVAIYLASCSSKVVETSTTTISPVSTNTIIPFTPTFSPVPPTVTPTTTVVPTATPITFTFNKTYENLGWNIIFGGQTVGTDGHLSLLCQVINIDREAVIHYANGVEGYITVTCAYKSPSGIQQVIYTFAESNFNTNCSAIVGISYTIPGTLIQENAGEWLDTYEKKHGALIGKVISLMFFDGNRVGLEKNIPTAEIIKNAYPNFNVFDSFRITGDPKDLPMIANTSGLVKPLMTDIVFK